MRGLLGAIAAHRHAAPPSPPPPCVVGEDQSAAVSLARPDVGEVLIAHASRQRLADRQPVKIRAIASAASFAAPSDRRPPSRRKAMRLNISSRSRSAFRGPSSRIAFGVSGRPMCLRTKPLNHSRRARACRRPYRVRRAAFVRPTLSARRPGPAPLERATQRGRRRCRASRPAIDRRRNGVQEVEARRVGNEDCRRSSEHDSH